MDSLEDGEMTRQGEEVSREEEKITRRRRSEGKEL